MRTSNSPKKAPVPVYMATTIVIFFLSLSAADSVGFVPYYIDGSAPQTTDASTSFDEAQDRPLTTGGTEFSQSLALRDLPELGPQNRDGEQEARVITALPESITIAAIGLDLPVQNPETRDIAELDEILKDGPVRYVDSAELGQKGNVLIFAHTSHLPVVRNQMYKAFNRISELEAGDTITVEGEGRTYLYTVTSVRQANANDAIIDLSPRLGKKLTLVTCDTLTSKSSRFILEADFVAVL